MIAIMVDSAAGISRQEAEQLGAHYVPMTYTVDRQQFVEHFIGENGQFEPYIEREDEERRTSQATASAFMAAFEHQLAKGRQVLCITISSRLSGTYANAVMAAKEVNADAIKVLDSRNCAGGIYFLILRAQELIAEGRTLGEIVDTLIADRKLPILEDVRDESTEDVRIVLVPRSRNVDPDILRESLYRLTDLESRFSLNLNVLDAERTPRVMGLKELLQHWLRHQFDVLRRRSEHRLARIDERLELVGGYIIAYLNLDRIIEIIRTEDEPKPVMMAEFLLTDRQAEAILNLRLRSLRKLEEMELVRERDALEKERAELVQLLDSPARQRTRMKRDLARLREVYGPETPLGRRRTTIAEAAPARDIPLEAMVEKEPVTVILSRRGWIRAMRGHGDLSRTDDLKFKEGDGFAFAVHAQTTDRILIAAANGRFYTLPADKLPGGRGFGEPVRLIADVGDTGAGDGDIVAMLPFTPSAPQGRLLVATTSGHGFVVPTADTAAETRKGKQVVNVKAGSRLLVVRPIAPGDDHVAAMGDNRKLVLFPLAELPEMARGQGVMLQRFRDGGLADARTLAFADGLSWAMGGDSGRTRTEADLTPWRTARGAAGRMAPTGFPRDNRFG